jgi:hypothetical protein
MQHMKRFGVLLSAAVLVTVVIGTCYGMAQQSIRLGANDAPRQAIDAYVANRDASQSNFTKINLAADSNVFVLIYDTNGKAIGGDGYLDNKLAVIPVGVLQNAKDGHENAVTWQPKSGVRLATVVGKDGNQYIVAGQSLKMFEERIHTVGQVAFAGWVVSMLVLVSYHLVLSGRK